MRRIGPDHITLASWISVLALLVGAGPARAVPIVPGLWYEALNPGPVGAFSLACAGSCVSAPGSTLAGAPPWTFSSPAAGQTLIVNDGFDYGDIFRVYDNNASIGVTSLSTQFGSCGSDPVACLADPLSSSGSFNLPAGAHSITIQLDQEFNPTGGGAFFFKLVPEPSIPVLLAVGLCTLAARRRGRVG